MTRSLGSWVGGTLLVAWAGCDCAGFGGLEAGGETPYVRCLAADPPPSESRRVGRATVTIDERDVRIEGLAPPVRIAAFAGPGIGEPPDAAALAVLAAAAPDLVFVLGGLGDDVARATATAKALATLDAPTFVVVGGRDTRERTAEALGRARSAPSLRGWVIDASAVRAIRLGNDTFVPVAGASLGRYAIEPRACGFGVDDLEALSSAIGTPNEGERRWLLAWEAPGDGGTRAIARTDTGIDTGSRDLAELARRVGAPGGVFAWPDVQVLRPSAADGVRSVAVGMAALDLRVVVPRLSGPAQERSDGSRVLPGFAVLRLDVSGLAVEAVHLT